MLVLTRKCGEGIRFGSVNGIRVVVLGPEGAAVRIGIEAPADVRVMREELLGGDAPSADRPTGERSKMQPRDAIEILNEAAHALELVPDAARRVCCGRERLYISFHADELLKALRNRAPHRCDDCGGERSGGGRHDQ